MARGWLVSMVVLVAVACSGRTKDRDPADDQGSAGERPTGGDTAAGGENGGSAAAAEGGASSRGVCAIAYRHDRCCPEPEAVSRSELESDPCLQEWTPLLLGPSKPSACSFPDCDAPCPSIAPESRAVELGGQGRCRFAAECETGDDCITLFNRAACCDCGRALPRSWQGQAECLLPAGELPPIRCGFCAAECDECLAPPALECVTAARGLARCEFRKLPTLEPGQCTSEHTCTGECDRCFPEGEIACGGPAPPPAECELDADCRDGVEDIETLICDEVPCQNRRCVPGCLVDDDCGVLEVCEYHHCRPAPCTPADTCGPNHTCVSSFCLRRTCSTSADCGDYCVTGRCHETPGECGFDCLP